MKVIAVLILALICGGPVFCQGFEAKPEYIWPDLPSGTASFKIPELDTNIQNQKGYYSYQITYSHTSGEIHYYNYQVLNQQDSVVADGEFDLFLGGWSYSELAEGKRIRIYIGIDTWEEIVPPDDQYPCFIFGNGGGDKIAGSSHADWIFCEGGSLPEVVAKGGNDYVIMKHDAAAISLLWAEGNGGDDQIFGVGSVPILLGDEGDDRLAIWSSTTPSLDRGCNGGAGSDAIWGDTALDILWGDEDGSENVNRTESFGTRSLLKNGLAEF